MDSDISGCSGNEEVQDATKGTKQGGGHADFVDAVEDGA